MTKCRKSEDDDKKCRHCKFPRCYKAIYFTNPAKRRLAGGPPLFRPGVKSIRKIIAVFLPLDEAIASRTVFVVVSGSDGRTDGRAETHLELAK